MQIEIIMEKKQSRSKPDHAKGLALRDQATQKYNVNFVIQELKRRDGLEIKSLRCLINSAGSILNIEPNLLKLQSPIVIVGDIHGQFYDLLNIFDRYGYPPETSYLFLGDYVDRGKFCIQAMTLLLVLKVNYPRSVYLLRGNHQSRLMTTAYNFKTECEVKYNSEIYELFLTLFMYLPLCAIIDKKYFGVHGGISPNLQKINQLQKVDRFIQLGSAGLICDLLWSDPTDDTCQTFKSNNLRSCSYFYSSKQSQKFLSQNALSLIIRGHEVQMKGYKYQYAENSKPLALTIFSAPKYCDTCYNKAAVAIFKKRTLTVDTFKEVEHPFVMNNYLDAFQVSFPLMAAKVTQVFSTLLNLKSLHQSLKKSTNVRQSEINSAIIEIKSIQDFLTNNATELEYLVKISTMVPTKLCSSSEMISEGLMRLLQLQCQQMNESLPFMFGPRQVQFVKIRASSAEEDDPDQQ